LARFAKAHEKLVDKVWPGYNAPFKLRLLSGDEQQACHADAFLRFKDLGLPPENIQCVQPYEEELIVQLLSRACRDPSDSTKPFALDADDLRRYTTTDQRAIVTRWYGDLREEVGPDFADLTQAQYEAIRDAVKKKDKVTLLRFGCAGLVTYMITTADPPAS
jgi:hypothetical protein